MMLVKICKKNLDKELWDNFTLEQLEQGYQGCRWLPKCNKNFKCKKKKRKKVHEQRLGRKPWTNCGGFCNFILKLGFPFWKDFKQTVVWFVCIGDRRRWHSPAEEFICMWEVGLLGGIVSFGRAGMIGNSYCQPSLIWSCLGNTPLGVSLGTVP